MLDSKPMTAASHVSVASRPKSSFDSITANLKKLPPEAQSALDELTRAPPPAHVGGHWGGGGRGSPEDQGNIVSCVKSFSEISADSLVHARCRHVAHGLDRGFRDLRTCQTRGVRDAPDQRCHTAGELKAV